MPKYSFEYGPQGERLLMSWDTAASVERDDSRAKKTKTRVRINCSKNNIFHFILIRAIFDVTLLFAIQYAIPNADV